ncbi:MAG: tetratricopeptide repeat protein, partial [Oscillospiraceae bacterium]|nr:tetratricopeptide repeat protein [Oscillospiraceae bacterium]
FYEISGYSDSREKANDALYQKAEKLLADGKTEDAELEFLRIYEYSDSADRVRKIRVERAAELVENGQLEQAIAALKSLDGEDVEQMLSDTKYLYAEILETGKNYNEAIPIFESLADYKDSAERAKKARYNRALGYIDSGDIDRAMVDFKALGDYADSADYIANMDEIRFKHCKVGDVITFGNFRLYLMEMGYAGDFDIDWKVIRRDGTRVLAVSEKIIDVREFGGENWSESALRQWLNNNFYNTCFTDSEKAMIPTVTVTTPDNKTTKINGGPDTKDKVFLLSEQEVFEYLYSERSIKPSFSEWSLEKYKLKMVEEEYRDHYRFQTTYWWTRSPGHLHDMTYITSDFTPFYYAKPDKMYGVRPAIWIEMGE